ncbi:MAG: hypothetical protein HYY03_02700 [Chloroflexi bacterium]|nr:hypothetical protein [Chloroflexota bacterium]
MIVSILMRKTEIKERAAWEARLKGALPKILEVFRSEPGFISVQYLWGANGDGDTGQITTWQTADDCLRYVREGGAATVGAFEDRALPTASHPNGAWVRKTYDVVET